MGKEEEKGREEKRSKEQKRGVERCRKRVKRGKSKWKKWLKGNDNRRAKLLAKLPL